jgi:hypothetical protein
MAEGAWWNGQWNPWGWWTTQWRCDTGWTPRFDPIAQTFSVDQMAFGMYTTAIDVYFRKKSSISPITLQLREVVNGYPSNTVVPFGEVTLQPSQVNVDEDGGQAKTTFVFPSPVYLKNNTEYCFVLLPAGNDPNYEVWVSQLGENIVNTTTRVSEQPSVGVLFTSSNNNTWTAFQDEDIKFTLYRADFDVNSVGVAEFENKKLDYLKLTDFHASPFEVSNIIHSFDVDITSGGTGYTDGTYNLTLSGGGATTAATVDVVVSGGIVTTVTVTNPGIGYTSNPTLLFSDIPHTSEGDIASATVVLNAGYIQSYDTQNNVAKVYVEKGSFTVNTLIGNGISYATLVEIEDKILNSLTANVGYVSHTPCEMIWSYAATTNTGTETGANDEFIEFIADKPEELTFDASIRSYSNEQNDLSGDKSFKMRVSMSTQTSTVSPIIDLRKCSIVATANDVNNSYVDEDTSVGEALSKYVSRRVVLDDGQEAEDLRVYLTNYLPDGTNVQVYAKLQHEADPESFDDKPWVLMDVNAPPPAASKGYAEYYYTMPADVLNGDGIYEYIDNDATYVGYKIFAVKIVFLSSKQCVVPKCKELRAIALQV